VSFPPSIESGPASDDDMGGKISTSKEEASASGIGARGLTRLRPPPQHRRQRHWLLRAKKPHCHLHQCRVFSIVEPVQRLEAAPRVT
jgi:hypothetical protein